MNLPDEHLHLKENITTGNVVAFVGAGMSVGAGLPNWYQLINELCSRIGYELPPQQWINAEALIDATQYYVNRVGANSLASFLKSQLDTTGKKPTDAHKALASLPISTIFTANYDDLLEQAYRDAGKQVQVIISDQSIPFLRRDPGVVNVIKLYGDLDHPGTIVLARQQYERYFLERPQMIKLLETELARSDMLYLGWSHTDPHFNLVFGEMLARFEQFIHKGYAVMFNVPDSQRLEFERKHIDLVELSPEDNRTTQLEKWLRKLAT